MAPLPQPQILPSQTRLEACTDVRLWGILAYISGPPIIYWQVITVMWFVQPPVAPYNGPTSTRSNLHTLPPSYIHQAWASVWCRYWLPGNPLWGKEKGGGGWESKKKSHCHGCWDPIQHHKSNFWPALINHKMLALSIVPCFVPALSIVPYFIPGSILSDIPLTCNVT